MLIKFQSIDMMCPDVGMRIIRLEIITGIKYINIGINEINTPLLAIRR